MSCWNQKSGAAVALNGHKRWLLQKMVPSKREEFKHLDTNILELKLKQQQIEQLTYQKQVKDYEIKQNMPNKLPIIEMLVWFTLICCEKESELNENIPVQDLARIVVKYLYPKVDHIVRGFDIIPTLGLSQNYFIPLTPYSCPFSYKPKHNFREKC